MTKEEKKAIKNLKRAQNDIGFGTLYSQEEEDKDIETVLNLIEELNKEKEESYYKGYAKREQEAIEICKTCRYKEESRKKDKIINEMAKVMSRNMLCDFIRTTDEKCVGHICEDCFRAYFINLVEEEEK